MNRHGESVISVSPDDLKYIGKPGGEEWKETSKSSEKTEEKPDMFRPRDPLTEDKTILQPMRLDPKPLEEQEKTIVPEKKAEDIAKK